MDLKSEILRCADELDSGRLKAERLRELADSVGELRQSLLYMQTWSTDIESELLGYNLIVNGERIVGAEDSQEWPYQSVAAAVKDGWRIISFPNMALLMDEERTIGYGCEFILEKMEPVT